MNPAECYQILNLPATATDEEIKKSFKILAHKYHPDKNRQNIEWANNAMADLNTAYTTLMKLRFREGFKSAAPKAQPAYTQNTAQKKNESDREKKIRKPESGTSGKKKYYDPYENIEKSIDPDILTTQFVKIREAAKDELYKYFQYGIYNIARREKISNKNVFNKIVTNLKKNYHSINRLKELTDDQDFIKHFNTFSSMIYNFYMASECVNIIDSYSDVIEIEAYRSFKKGDDILHPCEKEIFYDRHNRGFFKKNIAESLILKSELQFKNTLNRYPHSTWAVETKIKLQYVLSLKDYLYLFFSEYRDKK
ncbi:MAG: J domain-containing protein [Spirochaetes bacterium]|nr:J domain-containing protein [Spirochaetota bacterium]